MRSDTQIPRNLFDCHIPSLIYGEIYLACNTNLGEGGVHIVTLEKVLGIETNHINGIPYNPSRTGAQKNHFLVETLSTLRPCLVHP